MEQVETGRMWDAQHEAAVTWLADKLATHGTAIATGALGGIVAALRHRHARLGSLLKYGLVGGIVAPFTGSVLREFHLSPGVHDAGVFLLSVFAFRILDLLGDALDLARGMIQRRIERRISQVLGGDE